VSDFKSKIEYGIPLKEADDHSFRVCRLIHSADFIQCMLCGALWSINGKTRKMDRKRKNKTANGLDREPPPCHIYTDSCSAHGGDQCINRESETVQRRDSRVELPVRAVHTEQSTPTCPFSAPKKMGYS
jgi:hypothetical protein